MVDLETASKTAVSNTCSAWNAADAGILISKGGDTLTTAYPYKNGSNEGYRGSNYYIMEVDPTVE